jgi:hypothetical protein
MNQATSSTTATNIGTTIKATEAIMTITDLIILIKMIDAMIVVKMQGTTNPTTRRMITSVITSRIRATRPCIMTSPLCRAPAIHPEEGVNLVPDLHCALALVLTLAKAAGAKKTIMPNNMIASRAQPPNAGICTMRTKMTDITIART